MQSGTIFAIVTPGLSVIFAGAFFFVWLTHQKHKHIWYLSVAYLMLATGFAVAGMLNSANPQIALTACAGFTLFACVPFSQGLFMRLKASPPVKLLLSVATVATIANTSALYILESTGVSFLICIAAASLEMLIVAHFITQASKKDIAERSVPWVLGSMIVFLMVYLGYILHKGLPELPVETYLATFEWAILNLIVIFFSAAMAINLMILTVVDVTSDLHKRATIDALTGLLRRDEFENRVEMLVKSSLEDKKSLSLIMCDIDHFKRVNDTHGHLAGDKVIAELGTQIKSMLREGDLAGRIGGEEFGIILKNSNEKTARLFAEQLRSACHEITFPSPLTGVQITASFGTAQNTQNAGYRGMFAAADRALYQAKDLGRDQVVVADQSEPEAEVAGPLLAT